MKLLESARHQFIFWERLAVKFPANAQCQRGRKHAYDIWLRAVRMWRMGL